MAGNSKYVQLYMVFDKLNSGSYTLFLHIPENKNNIFKLPSSIDKIFNVYLT